MKIDCLMGTYGRYALASEATACFLQQTISNATLLIYNQHPRPLFFDHPRVRIVNEARPSVALRFVRQRMLELSDPLADLIHFWDDDDLYLPWHLEDCLKHIGDNGAWRPASGWTSYRNTEFSPHTRLTARVEGSWVFRAKYLKAAAIDTHPAYTDHPVYLQTEEAGLDASAGDAKPSYIYRWDTGTTHVSAWQNTASDEAQAANIALWRSGSTDVREDGVLVSADLTLRWRQYLEGIRYQVSSEDWHRELVRLQQAMAGYARRERRIQLPLRVSFRPSPIERSKRLIGAIATDIARVTRTQTSRGGRASSPEPTGAYLFLRALLTAIGPCRQEIASRACEIAQRPDIANANVWQGLAEEMNYHGVTLLSAPIVAALSRRAPNAVPTDARRAFLALASRHRQAAIIREGCVDRLLEAFATAKIPMILLKGAALAHLIYPAPELRPTVDIDILIDPANTEAAAKVARDLGYVFEARHKSDFSARMHHLPEASIIQSGFRISLEIHTDAMAPDQPYSLTFSSLSGKPRSFRRGAGPDGMALGHTDVLRHLARHAFEPTRQVRLIHLYDLWRYQAIFRDEIDWQDLQKRFGYVIVALRLVSCVFPDQQPELVPWKTGPCPAGAGFGMMQLHEIANSNLGPIGKLSALFSPPPWWLHGFYGVPLEQSLLLCRTVRHPATLLRWLLRRWAVFIGLRRD
ncbi:MAG: hypothetical protein E7813_09420 [Bradyrhizobium sp.]|uniref:nucleotidyltransferase family protein n=1 Tax=Bradyrhizobium sp. TaxID=376 RepID=UPI0012143173|nr:nucleotidyltransferase family protein [Bradyrhizobium sp.]THD70063.1 MAG: hypothetical protein E7813_09420 [Bradyrhizobium sp.]